MFRAATVSRLVVARASRGVALLAVSSTPSCVGSGNAASFSSEVQRVGAKYTRAPIHDETPEQFETRILEFLQRSDLDSWDIRQALTAIQMKDYIPDPNMCEVVLRACRRQNDLALALRFLEAIKIKCGNYQKQVYPHIMKEIKPVLEELGIPTIEELGWDKPELFCPEPAYYWDHSWYKKYGYDKNPHYVF